MSELKSQFTVTNSTGIHARPAAMLAGAASRFTADVRIRNGSDTGFEDGKSLMSWVTLGSDRGSVLTVLVSGPDAEAALDAITALFESDFNGI